mmetsp:Transcript_37233/g.63353  ORF Transcript_37233/g.63353 Transcript_37233/m.63353 type:complete len:101 (+) Transcript_37233:355-657(+)
MRLSVWDNKEIQIQVDDTDWNLPSYRIEDANCHEPLTDGNICIRQGTDLETVGNNGNISESASLCSCHGDCDNDKDCAVRISIWRVCQLLHFSNFLLLTE